MNIYDATGKELLSVRTIERDGNDLVIKGKIFGTMPMTAKVRPEEARKALTMMNFRLIWFILGFMFRRATSGAQHHPAIKG